MRVYFVPNRNFLIVLALLVLVLIAVPVFAQDATELPPVVTLEPTSTPIEAPTPVIPPEVEKPEDIIGVVLAALFAGAVTIAGSPFVTVLVSLEKLFAPTSVSADFLKNTTSVIVWIIYSLAVRFGLGTEFQGIANYITPILVTLVPLIGVLMGSSLVHQAAVATKVPLLSFKRE